MKDISLIASALVEFESVYKPTSFCNWLQDGFEEPIRCQIENAKHVIIGYKLIQIPEFNNSYDTKANENYYECLLRQKAFIDSINSVFLDSKEGLNSYLELRITNNQKTKTIDCYLILRLIISKSSSYYSDKRLTQEFKQLIPDDYGIVELKPEEVKEILHLGTKSLVEVRKKNSFLPVGSTYQPDNMVIAPRNLIDWDGKTRFYIPCASYIEPKTYNLSNLYKLLQNCNDQVQIRISLGSCKLFEIEKNLALQYYNMVRGTYSSINSIEINGSLNSFTKYVSASRLFSLKMQVASESEVAAMSIANSFCTQMSYGEIKAQTNLDCFPLKKFPTEIKKFDWEECNHHFYPFSYHSNSFEGTDDVLTSIILRMPYLCDASEAVGAFRLPIANASGLPGMLAKPLKPFYQPNPRSKTKREIQIGKIITSTTLNENQEPTGIPYSFPISDLTKHGLIVGSTGSGKTNTTLNFIKELTELGIPFLLIEPVKSEYFNELAPYFESRKLNRFNFKKPFTEDGNCNPEYLRFNPLIPIEGISAIQHISYIKGCFTAAFPMYGIMPMVLEECIYSLYANIANENERDLFSSKLSPKYLHDVEIGTLDENALQQIDLLTIEGLKQMVDKYLSNEQLFTDEDRTSFGSILKRRIEKLTKGVIGNALCPELWKNENDESAIIPNNIIKMLTEPTIVELEDLADNDEKALVMAFLLTYLFEYRQTKPSLISSELTERDIHITIIEEAHRLLSNGSGSSTSGGEDGAVTQDSKSKSISLFIDMLAEIRAKGEGIFIIEQIPTKLVSDVIKNTNLKIMHRITSKDDRHYLGEAMNMNEQQKNYVTKLKTGEAIIFDEQLDNPVFVKMNRFT